MVATRPRLKPNLVVIVGETASGKSALAMKVAKQFNGEVIAADSRTIYKGMDIGTAKPSREDQVQVPHHLIDLREPGESFTAADFKKLAVEAIDGILDRGKLPIMVGGTGLYVDSVLYDFEFRPAADPKLRKQLENLSVDELQAELGRRGMALPENSRNPRHLIRRLETSGGQAKKKSLRPNTLIVGLQMSREELHRNIENRIDSMLEQGFLDEAKQLSEKYGWESEAMKAPGYKAFRNFLEGSSTLEEAKEQFIKNDLNLAKRQRTWFKRNPSIQWFKSSEDGYITIYSTLNK